MGVDKYLKLLYPDYANEYQKNWKAMNRHEIFIEENLEQIDRKFKEAVQEREKNGEKVDNPKIMADVFDEVRTDIYFSLLYPNFGELSADEQEKAMLDKEYIFNHLEEMDETMERLRNGRYTSKAPDREMQRVAKKVFKEVLMDDYCNLLFWGCEEKSYEEIGEIEKDEEFMLENIEEVHREFQARTAKTGRSYKEQERQNILKDVIEVVRNEKEKDNKRGMVTPSAIADMSKKAEITSSQIGEAAGVAEAEKESKRR